MHVADDRVAGQEHRIGVDQGLAAHLEQGVPVLDVRQGGQAPGTPLEVDAVGPGPGTSHLGGVQVDREPVQLERLGHASGDGDLRAARHPVGEGHHVAGPVALEPDGQQPGVQPTGEGDEDLAAVDLLKDALDRGVERAAEDGRELLWGGDRVSGVPVGLPRAAAPGAVGAQLHHRSGRSGVDLVGQCPRPRCEASVQEDLGGLLIAHPGRGVSAQLLRVVADDPGVARAGEQQVVGTGAVRGQAHEAVVGLDECPGPRAPLGPLAPQGLQVTGPER